MTNSIARAMRHILLHSRAAGGIAIGDIMKTFGEASIELWLLIFAALSCLPLSGIPGYTTVTGVPIVFFGAQLCLGRKSVWLPEYVMKRRISSPAITRSIRRSLPWMRRLERLLKPRLLFLSEPAWLPLYGAVFVIVGGLMALPLPLINLPCAVILLLLSAGLVANDGRVIILALSLLFCGIMAGFSLLFLFTYN